MVTMLYFVINRTMNCSQMAFSMVLAVAVTVINVCALDANIMEYIMNREKLGSMVVKNGTVDQNCQVWMI